MTLIEHRDRIIQRIVKPIFKSSGYNVAGITFKKPEQGFIKLFNIQSSQFNHQRSVGFYLNIGFLFPIEFVMSGSSLPGAPKIHDCQFRFRSDALTGRNQYYELTPDLNVEEFESLLQNDIREQVIPFFDRYRTIEDCARLQFEKPNDLADIRPWIGLTMISNGEVEKGDKLLNESLHKTTENWKKKIMEFRKKLR